MSGFICGVVILLIIILMFMSFSGGNQSENFIQTPYPWTGRWRDRPQYKPCPSHQDILRLYGCYRPYYTWPIQTAPSVPLGVLPINESYNFIGYLYKEGSANTTDDPYKVLPLYGREYRNNSGLFIYYVEYYSGNRLYKKMVYKSKDSTGASRKISRELYDGDVIYLGFPFDSDYVLRVENFEY